MASFRFSAKVISRADNRSAVACAAYRSGDRLFDERTGKTHDYTARSKDRRDGLAPSVVDATILCPDNTPEWMRDRAALWNACEAIEIRRDAQLSREIQVSLPHELNDDQRRELLHDFVQSAFVSKGMIADVGIHRPDAHGDNRNHHAHIMLTMRELTAEGFNDHKARHWNNKKFIEQWREQWAKAQNKMLERHGRDERVTHLSLKAQGIERVAQIHLGTAANQLMKRGADHPRVERLKAVQQRNAHLQRRNDRLEIVRKGRLQQITEANREIAQLNKSIRKAGLWKFWDTLTGKRKAELTRIEDIKAEAARAQVLELKAKQQQEANRREQAAILKRQADAKAKAAARTAKIRARQKAANDEAKQAPQKPPEQSKPRPPTTKPRPASSPPRAANVEFTAQGKPRPMTGKPRPSAERPKAGQSRRGRRDLER